MKKVVYIDDAGKKREWDSVERPKYNPKQSANAVLVLPLLTFADAPPEVALVAQFRPAVGKKVLEMPAGFIDFGETAIEAAQRELKEETGYHVARVLSSTLSPLLSSPGKPPHCHPNTLSNFSSCLDWECMTGRLYRRSLQSCGRGGGRKGGRQHSATCATSRGGRVHRGGAPAPQELVRAVAAGSGGEGLAGGWQAVPPVLRPQLGAGRTQEGARPCGLHTPRAPPGTAGTSASASFVPS